MGKLATRLGGASIAICLTLAARAPAAGANATPSIAAATSGDATPKAADASAPATSEGVAAAPAPAPTPAALEPAAAPPTAAAAAAAPAPADPFGSPGDFAAPAEDAAINLKVYGDTQFEVRSHTPVHASFQAAHLDLFPTADVGRLSFLSEVFFEAGGENEFAVDVERVQISYLVANWLRIRAGRTHTAFGYYNDTYHHGNLFELTTERPYAVNFEDSGGLFVAHLVGLGADGSFDAGSAGSFRYDLEVGNGRLADTSGVAVNHAGKDDKLVNLRLRWMPIDGLILGVNGIHDQVPARPSGQDPERPKVGELIGGAHAVYMEHDFHVLLESYLISHAPSGGKKTTTRGGFIELGRAFGELTPYARAEVIRFPKQGDVIYQDASSPYVGVRTLFDARLGLRWLPLPQLALKLEVGRVSYDSTHQESATVKAAFGF